MVSGPASRELDILRKTIVYTASRPRTLIVRTDGVNAASFSLYPKIGRLKGGIRNPLRASGWDHVGILTRHRQSHVVHRSRVIPTSSGAVVRAIYGAKLAFPCNVQKRSWRQLQRGRWPSFCVHLWIRLHQSITTPPGRRTGR